jgi:predicted DNA-binding antitoxin AbrB/MazE fold protein
MKRKSPMQSRVRGSVSDRMTVTAKYEDGVFKPLEEVKISEGTVVEVRIPSYADRLKNRARSVAEFAFYGMWKDRTDIGDSVEYVSNLRRNLRG